jgi:hypothetical protein
MQPDTLCNSVAAMLVLFLNVSLLFVYICLMSPLPGIPIHFLYDCLLVVVLSLLNSSIMHCGHFWLKPGALISASHIPAVAMPDMPD